MTVQEMIAKVPELSVTERRQLMDVILDSIIDDKPTKKRSISELRGLGAEIWEGVDVDEYIRELRSEWDHRP